VLVCKNVRVNLRSALRDVEVGVQCVVSAAMNFDPISPRWYRPTPTCHTNWHHFWTSFRLRENIRPFPPPGHFHKSKCCSQSDAGDRK